jgi:hypothetical protein
MAILTTNMNRKKQALRVISSCGIPQLEIQCNITKKTQISSPELAMSYMAIVTTNMNKKYQKEK